MPDRPEPGNCPHEHSEPVEVRDRLDGVVKTVARICTFCLARLPAAWGCQRCEWVEGPRRLCDVTPVPPLVLTRPCQEHA